MALFFCKRSASEPAKMCTPRFTVREIDPFIAVEHRDNASVGGLAVVVIGVAIQKPDGKWGVHELSDEMDVCRSNGAAIPVEMERLRNKAVLQMKRRLVNALNRLREHYERVYVYHMKP